MSKGDSGHFLGTNGANIANSSFNSETESSTAYTATASLKNHIVNPESSTSGKQGIKGAHHKGNFINEVNRIGAKTTGSIENSQIKGVEKISYKMPKKDKFGNTTGEFQSKTHHKTVYDTSKIRTDQYIKRGLAAANNAASKSTNGKLKREWTGTDSQGVKWRGYCDSKGNITSFYPED